MNEGSILNQFIDSGEEEENIIDAPEEQEEVVEEQKETPEEKGEPEEEPEPEEVEESGEEEDEEDEEDEGEEDTSAEDFWKEVKEKGGYDSDFEFEEGVDPLSPEAIVKILERERRETQTGITQHLKDNFPVTWKAFEAEQKGLDPFKAFRNIQNEPDFLETELKEEDYDTHESVIKHFLKEKGLSDKQIQRQLKAIKEDDSTYEEAQFAQKELKKEADLKKQKELEAAEARAKEIEENDRRITKAMNDRIGKGKLGNFKIVSEKDKQSLLRYVGERVRRNPDGKTYTISLDLNDESMDSVLQAMFFLNKNGDLSKYVDEKADTKAARLRLKNVKKSREGIKGAGSPKNQGGLSNFM